jgi:large repetitive protein
MTKARNLSSAYDTANTADNFVKLDNTSKLPALDGSLLTGVAETKPTISSISPDTITNASTNIVITGTNFVITPNVEIISTTGAIYYPNTVTRNSASQLTINATLAVDGTYFIRVENPDGLAVRSSTALLTVSDAPTWTTASGSLGSVAQGASFSTTVVATSDSAITYSVQSGALPTGLTLNTSTGVISGTESGNDTGETVYNFTLRATDAETQTADRAFTITVTVGINNAGQFN